MQDSLLVLENDGIFSNKLMNCYKTEQVDALAARQEICAALTRLELAATTPAEREEMRLYFEERYSLKPGNRLGKISPTNRLGKISPTNRLGKISPTNPTNRLGKISPTNPTNPTNLLDESAKPAPTTPATNTMSKAITVTTQVNVNGVNADNYTDAQLFDMIRQQENEIKNLQALTNKPQSLLREISTRQAGIDALVSFMNERDAKLNPQPAKPAKPTGPALQTLQGCA